MSNFVLPLTANLSVASVIFNDYIVELKESESAYILTARRGSDVQTLSIPKGGNGGGPGESCNCNLNVEELMQYFNQKGIAEPLVANDGSFYTDNDGNIYVL
jgi:hypothetical protein